MLKVYKLLLTLLQQSGGFWLLNSVWIAQKLVDHSHLVEIPEILVVKSSDCFIFMLEVSHKSSSAVSGDICVGGPSSCVVVADGIAIIGPDMSELPNKSIVLVIAHLS